MASKGNKNVSFGLKLLGWKQFAEGADAGSKSIKNLGASAETAGRKASSSQHGWGIFSRQTQTAKKRSDEARLSVGKLAKGLGALGVGYEALSGIKDSIDTTKELGEATLNLNKIQGLSLSSASQYAMVAQVRGIGQKQLAQGLNILSRNTINAEKQWTKSNDGRVASSKATNAKLLTAQQAYDRKIAVLGNSAKDRVRSQLALQEYQQKRAAILAGKKGPGALGTAADAFKSLGFSRRDVTSQSKDMGKFLLEISDRFNKMPGGVKKSQLALQLFGRGAQKIVPLFKEGDESLRTNLKWAKQYGVAMGGENPKQLRKFLVAQDKAHYATLGMQVALGQYLAPAVIKVMEAWPKMIDNIKKGNGVWGPIKTVVTTTAGALGLVIGLFSKSKLATDVLVGGLTVLGAAWGIEKIVLAAKAVKEFWLVSKFAAGAQWGLRASMMSLPGAVDRTKGAWSLAGTKAGGWMGKAAGIGIAAAIISQLPSIYKMLPFGDSFHHEANRGFKDLLGPLAPESAGNTKADKQKPKRGLSARGLASYLFAHPREIGQDLASLSPEVKSILRGDFQHAGRKVPPGLGAGVTAKGASSGEIVLHVHSYLDGKEVAQNVSKHQIKLRARQ